MKRSDAIKGMVSMYESILDSSRGDTFESIMDFMLLYQVQELGMLPPPRSFDSIESIEWEDEDEA